MTVTVKNIIARKQVEAVQTGQYTASTSTAPIQPKKIGSKVIPPTIRHPGK